MSDPLRIEKLRADHPVDGFDCGSEQRNRFLIRFALSSQQAGAAQTYVALSGSTVVGYFSLAVGEVADYGAPNRLSKGLVRHPILLMLLARLAVSSAWQGQGLGAGMLKDAMRRALQAADIAGIRAFAVHAKDERARVIYAHFGFIPSPTDPYHLYLLIKDIRRIEGASDRGNSVRLEMGDDSEVDFARVLVPLPFLGSLDWMGLLPHLEPRFKVTGAAAGLNILK